MAAGPIEGGGAWVLSFEERLVSASDAEVAEVIRVPLSLSSYHGVLRRLWARLGQRAVTCVPLIDQSLADSRQ